MAPRVSSHSVEVFLVVDQPRQRVSHWTRALAPLDADPAPRPTSIDAYFDPAANQAIFVLRFEPAAIAADGLRRINELAVLTEVSLIQPSELSEGERRRFAAERLGRCAAYVDGQRTVVEALVELVRRVRTIKVSASDTTPPVLPRFLPGEPPRSRRDSADAPPQLARGTRNVADPAESLRALAGSPTAPLSPTAPVRPIGSRDFSAGGIRLPGATPEPSAELLADAPYGRELEAGGASAGLGEPGAAFDADSIEPITTPARALVPSEPRRPSPNVVSRSGVHRANTVTMSSAETQRILEASSAGLAELVGGVPPEPPRAPGAGDPPRPTGELPAGTIPPGGMRTPSAARAAVEAPGEAITARYLRNGRWVAARIASLSLRGAALMAVTMPRVDDRVEIAVAYASHRALVRGAVSKVSSMVEAAASGATTFAVAFELDDTARRQLTALLVAARAANVTIMPPPPRSTRRYPVEWPVCLGTTRGAIRAEALDVSATGMFVRPLHALSLDTNLTFTAVLDDGHPPVSGRSRVVRSTSDADAVLTGRPAGYGMSIVEMSEADRERWRGFLGRIEQRAGRRVLIGASPIRFAELQGGLIAAGYAVTGGSDAATVAELARGEAQPIDAGLLDAGWLAAGGLTARVESVLAARKLPCVTVHGDARRARIAIDKLLSVA